MSATEIITLLAARGETLAVAESLTGGLLAATIVDVPGASAVFRGGFVVYATDLKATLAGVPEDLLAERGPVDPDVAAALADGARQRCGASWGLATTGVAGPTRQNGIEVGTAYIGFSAPDGTTDVEALRLDPTLDRSGIRRATVTRAIAGLADRIAGANRTGAGRTGAGVGEAGGGEAGAPDPAEKGSNSPD